jgi:hypothetical protein
VFGLCCYTSDTGQSAVAIWNMVHGLFPNHRNDERHTAWTFRPCRKKPGTWHTTKVGSPTLVLITHFAAEIMLIAFLNQGCESPSLGFECHLTADVAECIQWIYRLRILLVEQTLCASETITHWALANNWQRTVSHMCMTCDTTYPEYLLQATSDSHM